MHHLQRRRSLRSRWRADGEFEDTCSTRHRECRGRAEALREREQLFRAVFFDSSDAILLVDDRRTIIDANPAASSLFGLDRSPVGRGQLDQLVVEPVDTWIGLWRELLALGEARREHPVSRPQGSRVVECLYRARVRPGCHLCVARDITDRRLLDERLAQVARIESVGRLAGGIAHDFNNLLTAVLGFTELLLANHPPGDPERDDLEEIQKAGKRASLLTQQLLAFGRRQMLEPQEVDLNLTIGGIHALLRRVLRGDIGLTIEVARAPAVVMIVRPGRGRRWSTSSSIPATRCRLADPSRFNCRWRPCRWARCRRAPRGARPCGSASPTTAWSSPEARAHLFEPFFTTKQQGKAQDLASRSSRSRSAGGGFILVDNPSRGGTVVTLYFPALGVVRPHVDHQRVPGRETILLVEDEDPVRAVIGALLRRNGYTVLEAATPQGAHEIFQLHAGEIALLLTAAVTPARSRPELAERCVAEKPTLRVLFISNSGGVASLEVTGPRIAFLEKPFAAPALAAAVRALLDQAER